MKRGLFLLSLVFALTGFVFSGYAQESELYMKEGISLISKKKYQEAYDELDKAYKLDSKDPNILAFRGQALHYLKKYTEAIEDYNKALELQPNYAEVYHLRGLAYYALKNSQKACEDWEEANKLGYNMVVDLIVEYCMKNKTNKQ